MTARFVDPSSARVRFRTLAPVCAALAVAVAACSGGAEGEQAAEPTVAPRTSGDDPYATSPPTPSTAARAELGDPVGWTDPDGATVMFTDVTGPAGVAVTFSSALEVELDKDTAVMMGGAGAGDFDNDGDTDLFVLGGGHEIDSLFVNDGTGVFTDVAESAGLAEPHLGSGVALGDYDADGWIDIFVTSHGTLSDGAMTGGHRLFRNNGDLTFTDVAAEAGVATTSTTTPDGFGAVFGDIDLDGDLDLFVAGWQRDAMGNRLFENQGDGTFADVTERAGIVDDGIRGFSPCLIDMTGDRYPELLLVSDFGTSRYWSNAGAGSGIDGRFVDTTESAEVGKEWSGMGTAVGDVNNDGLLDWYATAIYDADDVGRGIGNVLYLNRGDNSFEEVAATAGVDDGAWGWGAVMVDVNHDGWLDLIETNGWDLPSYVGNLSRMWIADGAGAFVDVAAEAGPLHDLHGLGVLSLDLESDGDQDIAITASNDEFRLYRNDLTGGGSWLRVLVDTSADPSLAANGIGSMIRAETASGTMTRTIGGCSNYNTTSELSAHFGLGATTVVDRLVVEWPDGRETVLSDVDVDQTLVIDSTD